MSKPLGGPQDNGKHFELTDMSKFPQQSGDPTSDKLDLHARSVLSPNSKLETTPPSLSLRNARAGGTEPFRGGEERSLNDRKEEVLQAWKRSLPWGGIFSKEADNLIRILMGINLDSTFTVDLKEPNFLGFVSINSLPDVFENCEEFRCEDYSNLKALPPLPNCKKLWCRNCLNLEAIPELRSCENLHCENLPNFTAIPELPACTRFHLKECTRLQALPELPACTKLDLYHIPNLKALPSLPKCEVLNCTSCYSLKKLPSELPKCTRLCLKECRNLEALPELPACTKLDLYDIPNLKTLLPLPKCEVLNCTSCNSLKKLPALPACTRLRLVECRNLEDLPELTACIELHCEGCLDLKALPELPACTKLDLYLIPNLKALPELPACTRLCLIWCTNLESVPELPACIELHCEGCLDLKALPELPACTKLILYSSLNLKTLPELPVCRSLNCRGCNSLKALPELPECEELYVKDCSNLKTIQELPKLRKLDIEGSFDQESRDRLQQIVLRIRRGNFEIGGVVYSLIGLPEQLRVPLTPPLPDGASIEALETDLQSFIERLNPSNLPLLQKEIHIEQSEQDLESYKQMLTEWKRLLFSRVRNKSVYVATPPKGTEELDKFYKQIVYYLLHLSAFLTKEENQDAFIERLVILKTQAHCGSRFIAELEQLFSMNCIGGETPDLSKQFAQIASTEAKLAIGRMYPEGNVHQINQAMFQLREYLTGTYLNDQLVESLNQDELIVRFLGNHTPLNLVKTIQASLKPSSPLEHLFTRYLKENFSPELSQEQLDEVIRDVNELWEATKEGKIAAFEKYDCIRKKPAQERTAQENFQMKTLLLTQEEKACRNKEELEGLLKSREKSFKDENIRSGVESKKDEILYQEHYDQVAGRWRPEIIAKALQKMGILATKEVPLPRPAPTLLSKFLRLIRD